MAASVMGAHAPLGLVAASASASPRAGGPLQSTAVTHAPCKAAARRSRLSTGFAVGRQGVAGARPAVGQAGENSGLVMDPNDGFKLKRPEDLVAGRRRQANSLSPSQEAQRQDYLEEYAEVKKNMLAAAAKAGAASVAYVALTNTSAAGCGTFLGAAAGLGYLYLYQQYIDELDTSDERVQAVQEARKVGDFYRRTAMTVGAAVQQALGHKRMLLPAGVVAGVAAYNGVLHPEIPVPMWSLLLGFASYKAGVYSRVYDEAIKKELIAAIIKDDMVPGKSDKPSRPTMKNYLASEELDAYGRPIYVAAPQAEEEAGAGGEGATKK